MNLLSAKLDMTEKFSEEDYFKTIAKWLRGWSVTADMADMLEAGWMTESDFNDGRYAESRIMRTQREGAEYVLFRLKQKYRKEDRTTVDWTTEVIWRKVPLETPGYGENVVYIRIGCSEHVEAQGIPEYRTGVVSAFVESGLVRRTRGVPETGRPVEATDDLFDWFRKAVDGRYAEDMPLVMATEYFNHPGGAIDESTLARKLSGFAYVAMCDNDYTQRLKDRSDGQPPFNGFINVYTKGGGKPKSFHDRDEMKNFDDDVTRYVREWVTANVERDTPTWDGLDSENARIETEVHRQLLQEADDVIYTKDDRIAALEKQVAELSSQVSDLTGQRDYYAEAFKKTEAPSSVIDCTGIEELYAGELHDLLVTVLDNARQNSAEHTRKSDLLDDLLRRNELVGEGLKIIDTVNRVFAEGAELNEKKISELKKVGFVMKSENDHYKFVFKDSQYWFTVSRTPSDFRSGKNQIKEIMKSISVYK